jgi:predicted deacylase
MNPGDGRPPLADLFAAFDQLTAAGWRRTAIATQSGGPGLDALPITAWSHGDAAEVVLIAGIHGREPAGPAALARAVPLLIAAAATRSLLVLPMLNPWGYLHHERYGPSGQSVSDSDHLLGRSVAPACPEADAITAFVLSASRIRPGAAVLDLHEDPVYEAPDYCFDGFGSYLYFVGDHAADRPASARVRDCLAASRLPLVRSGVTRFNETLVDGAILDSADGSIDELLARRAGCTPVITVENLLHAPDAPPLATRIEVYADLVAAFLGAPA